MRGEAKIAIAAIGFLLTTTAVAYAVLSLKRPALRKAETAEAQFSAASSTAGCWSIADEAERLKCYDSTSAQAVPPAKDPSPAAVQSAPAPEYQLSPPRDPSLPHVPGVETPAIAALKPNDSPEDIAFLVVYADLANKLCSEREAPAIAAHRRKGMKLTKALVQRTTADVQKSITQMGVPAFCESVRKILHDDPATAATATSSSTTFDMTPAELTKGYSARLRQDKDDGIRNCSSDDGFLTCTFDDDAFRGSVKQMKEMNLINGNITSQQLLLVGLSGGKVSYVSIAGDRRDPANLLAFVGKVGSMLHHLGSRLTDKEVDALLGKLGLMRGDSDPTIGNQMTEITDTFAVRCSARNSKVSTLVGCRFDPRF